MKTKIVNSLLLTLFVTGEASAEPWVAISDTAEVKKLFSDTVLTSELKKGVTTTARFNSDGTGELKAWDDTFPREWKVDDNANACILISQRFECFTIEKNTDTAGEYRGTNTTTGASVVFNVSEQKIQNSKVAKTNAGGAGAPSAEEMAAKLSNPTSPVMTIGNNFDFITFKGDLPDADDQTAFRYVFQTTFPYKLSNGGSVFFRPAIPILFDDPIPSTSGGFTSKGTDIGDIGYDFSYGITTKSGLLWGAGVAGTMPTATDDSFGKDLWALGPEILIGKIGSWGVVGALVSHQKDIAGSGDGEIDITSASYFYAFPLGGGWQFASGPSVTYDHTKTSSDDKLSLPLGIGLAKTAIFSGRPWKFQVQYWNYIEAAEPFAPEHQIRISINPVVAAPWNEGK